MSLDEEQLAAGKSAADIHADELAGLAVRVGTRCATFHHLNTNDINALSKRHKSVGINKSI